MHPRIRLFFALWPDEPVRKAILRIGDQYPPGCGRRISGENLHLTVQFLGSVDIETRKSLEIAAAQLDLPRFSLRLDSSGWWKPAKVAWVAPAQVPAELQYLYNTLHTLAQSHGVSVEERPYRPHVTQARKVPLPVLLQFEPVRWNITDYCLAESLTQTGYAEYRIIRRWALT